jgi:hypothetical protein
MILLTDIYLIKLLSLKPVVKKLRYLFNKNTLKTNSFLKEEHFHLNVAKTVGGKREGGGERNREEEREEEGKGDSQIDRERERKEERDRRTTRER